MTTTTNYHDAYDALTSLRGLLADFSIPSDVTNYIDPETGAMSDERDTLVVRGQNFDVQVSYDMRRGRFEIEGPDGDALRFRSTLETAETIRELLD